MISFHEFSIKKDTKWNWTESLKKNKLKEYLNGLNNLQFKDDSGDNDFSTKSATYNKVTQTRTSVLPHGISYWVYWNT